MSFFNRLIAVLVTAALLAPLAPLQAKTKKGDKFLADGRMSEAKKDWDAALESYEKALSEDPAEIVYRIAAEKARFQASQLHLDAGLQIRAKGQLGDALMEFQKAYAINPASPVAVQEIQQTQAMIFRERKRVEQTGQEAAPEVRALSPADTERKAEQERIDRILPVPELRPLKTGLIDLVMNGKTKTIFDTIGKYAGINVLWDPEYNPPTKDLISVNFEHTTLEQALDYVQVVTHSFWKALSPNTIFITNDNQNKRRDYEEMVVKTFYLQNVVSPQEMQEITNAVRTVPELQRVFPDAAQYAIVVRGEADKVALAEKIIHDLDKARPEVLVDILVLQASSVFSRQITAAIASTGLNMPFNFTPRSGLQVVNNANPTGSTGSTGDTGSTGTTTTTTGTLIPISNLGHIASSDFATTLPSALLQAAMSDAKTKVLQAPELRATDNSKAILKVGEKVPTASGSFQPGIGGVGINPLVNTQFQYLDVGVNIELTARVHPNDEVTMHITLDISNVDGQVPLGGINQPIIGQRKVDHDFRMREGEVGLIGGLVSQQDDKTVTGIPGLSSIPLFGHLFKGSTMDHNRNDLVIIVIPHIVRRQDIDASNLRAIAAGNQAFVKVGYAARPEETPVVRPPSPGPQPGGTVPGGPPPGVPAVLNPVGNPTPPAATGGEFNPAAGNPVNPALPPATAPALMPPATAPPLGPTGEPVAQASKAVVRFSPAPIETATGATFAVSLLLDNGTDIAAAPIQIQYDPKILTLNNASNGGLLPVITKNVDNEAGVANIQLSLPPGNAAGSGSGTLVNLSFTATGKGATTVRATNMIRNSQGQVITSGTPQISVTVK